MQLFRPYRSFYSMILVLLLVLVASLGTPQSVTASDCVEITPVTDSILLLRCVDGFIDAYGPNERITDNRTYHDPLDLGAANILTNYLITSEQDPAYSIAKHPIYFGRKSKALDYNAPEDPVPFVLEHSLYIELPSPLTEGYSYEILLSNLVKNGAIHKLTFDSRKIRSETVHVNLVGFPEHGSKFAYLSHWMGDFNTAEHNMGGLNLDRYTGATFHLIDQNNGKPAFSGQIHKRMQKNQRESSHSHFAPHFNYSHADVWECDFSSFTVPGTYVVAVNGIGCSYPFEIDDNSTREPFYYAMKGLFSQRQGIVKEIEPGLVLPRDHHPDDIVWQWDAEWPGGESTTSFNTNAPQIKGIWGHYFDAGDWDGYVHHAKVPMSLLLLYTLAPDRFSDGEIGNRYKLSEADMEWIDEGNNGLPDLLDEAVWLLNYYQRARHVLMENYGGTGGVPGYVGRDAIPGNNITAWMDTRNWYLSAENTEQTYLYAGLAAWYASCLNEFQKLTGPTQIPHPDADQWIEEALASWNWAEQREVSTNAERRARGFAATLLYRHTSDPAFHAIVESYLEWEPNKNDGEWSNPNLYDLVITLYSLLDPQTPGINASLQQENKERVLEKVNLGKLGNSESNAFRMGIEYSQFFELGSLNTPKMTLVPVAYKLTGDVRYLHAMQNALSYILGGNQLNQTYLSGLGERSDQSIFNPNGWLTNNPDSMVYANTPFNGLTSYFGANQYWFTSSVHSELSSRAGAYPDATQGQEFWPAAESNFRNRYSIQGGEFTVHQQNNYQIFTTGFVKAMSETSTKPYEPEPRPKVNLRLVEGQKFPVEGSTLTVEASENTQRVDYYWDWHFIGSSMDKTNGFELFWIPPVEPGNQITITAVATNSHGTKSAHSILGEHTVWVTEDSTSTCSFPETIVYRDEPAQLTPFQHFQKASSGAHAYALGPDEIDELNSESDGNWAFVGTSHQLISNPVTGSQPVFRLENKDDRFDFFTLSEAELTLILRKQSQTFEYGGIAAFAYPGPISASKPVFRFRSQENHSHFFTIDESEKDLLIVTDGDLQYEGIAWWGY